MDQTTAIIGAGWLGAAIADATPGHVIATTRDGRRPPALADHVAVVAHDVGQHRALGALATARAWLFAIAPGAGQDRRAVYVDGPAAMLAALPDTAVRRVVWIGSTSALPDDDALLDETCDGWPSEPRGIIQRQAEQRVIEACTRANVPWMILRCGGLYGPGRELGRIFGRADTGGDGDRATNLVHRDDAVAAVVAALASDRSGIVHVVADDHCPRRVMIDTARAQAGLPPATWPSTAPLAARGKRVDNRRLAEWLGVTLQHPRHSPLATPEPRA